MKGLDWNVLLVSEASTAVLCLMASGIAAYRCRREIRETPERAAAAHFRLARFGAQLPLAPLLVAFVLWKSTPTPAPPQLAATVFAIAWTALAMTWAGCTLIQSTAFLAANPGRWTRAAYFSAGVCQSAWFVLTPLLAGWAAVAWRAVDERTGDQFDPAEALCFALAAYATNVILKRVMARRSRANSMAEASAKATLLLVRAAGTSAVPPVSVMSCRDAGLPDALAYRHGRSECIALDAQLFAEYPEDETAAILLHELGHHRLGHVRRRTWVHKAGTLVVVLAPTALGFGHVAVFTIGAALLRRISLASWRAQELEADRFAAQKCSADAVGRALTRLHRTSSTPDDFESARSEMTHPDLIRRLEALGLTPAAPSAR